MKTIEDTRTSNHLPYVCIMHILVSRVIALGKTLCIFVMSYGPCLSINYYRISYKPLHYNIEETKQSSLFFSCTFTRFIEFLAVSAEQQMCVDRRNQYKKAALAAKHSGDMTTAAKYVKISKVNHSPSKSN